VFTPTLLVIAISVVVQAAPPTLADQKDVLIIEGATNPAQIPEWLAWEYSFTLLDQWRGRDSGFTHDLKEAVSPAEFELLEKEGATQQVRLARRGRLAAKLIDKYPYATTTDPKVIDRANEEVFAIELEYRRDILAGRDRLLQVFSTESQAVLLDWVAGNKAAITSHVPKSDLKRYRSPE
jgi:hypothetical protein